MKAFDYNDIARYAEDDMTTEERQQFEAALASDASLQEQLALYREVHASLSQHFHKDSQQEQLEVTLQDMRKEFFRTSASRSKVVSLNRYLRAAVAVAAVFIITLIIWRPWQPGLFEQYADVQMVDPTERGDSRDTLLQQAAIAFNKEDYDLAAARLAEARIQKPEDSFTSFYYAVALVHLHQDPMAKEIFAQLFAGESIFKYEAAFFLALTYLKEENRAACREWLQKIPADAGNYAKAKELLDKLR